MCTGEMLLVRYIRTSHLHSSSANKHKQSKVRILELYSNEKEKRGHPLTTNQSATNHVLPNKKTKTFLALKHSCSLKRSFDNDEAAVVQYYSDKKKLAQSRPLIRSCKVTSAEINEWMPTFPPSLIKCRIEVSRCNSQLEVNLKRGKIQASTVNVSFSRLVKKSSLLSFDQ